jgi:ribosome biogenesis GTPase
VLSADNKVLQCRIKGLFRMADKKFSNPVAVGDWVNVEIEPGQNTYMINEVLDRKNYICRTDPHRKAHKQIIASNLDQAVVVTSLYQPRVPLGFIDRFSVIAEMYHIPLQIIFNKCDIYDADTQLKFEEAKSIYEDAGYQVHLVSLQQKINTDILESIFQNKISLISGQSGVGKTALINYLCPDLKLKTQQVSDANEKGQHTTTFAEMHQLNATSFIIDTPGVKELSVADIELEEISHYFAEMRKFLPDCKFNNCKHIDEPDCAVKSALEQGLIHPLRFGTYMSIIQEVETGLKFWQKK